MNGGVFTYRALRADGASCRGRIRALTSDDAYRQLKAQGLMPTSIEERARFWSPGASRPSIDIAAITRELATLLQARIPLDRGLISVAEGQDNPAGAAIIRDLASMVAAGAPLTDGLLKHRAVFGEVYIETMRAAERSGRLAEVTEHLADLLERQTEARQQLRRAAAYPAIVMAVVAAALVTIVVFVVPRFGAVFAAQGVELPAVTRVVRAVGEAARAHWYVPTGALVAGLAALRLAWGSDRGRVAIESALLSAPYVGRMLTSALAARFSRVFAIALSSGLGVLESLEMSGRATGHRLFARETSGMARRLRGGEEIASVLAASRVLPSFARRMLGAGKDTAELSRAAQIVSRHYDREASHLARNINTFIEPLMTVAMAGIVLLVALSVFLPMWSVMRVHR